MASACAVDAAELDAPEEEDAPEGMERKRERGVIRMSNVYPSLVAVISIVCQ